MKAVVCKNKIRKNASNDTVMCRKILAVLPGIVLEALKANPNVPIYFRCPSCSAAVKWAKVYYNDRRQFVFESGVNSDGYWPEQSFDVILSAEEA